jgi:hypothetical protein
MPEFVAAVVSIFFAFLAAVAWLRSETANQHLRQRGHVLPSLGSTPLPRAISIPTKTRKENLQ